MTEEKGIYEAGPASLFSTNARETPTYLPPEDHIKEMLDDLYMYQLAKEELALIREEKVQAAIPDDVKAEIQAIKKLHDDKIADVELGINFLNDKITKAVLSRATPVKGSHLMAIFNRGRVTWDSKRLAELSVSLPVLLDARKVGDNYVSFKKV